MGQGGDHSWASTLSWPLKRDSMYDFEKVSKNAKSILLVLITLNFLCEFVSIECLKIVCFIGKRKLKHFRDRKFGIVLL